MSWWNPYKSLAARHLPVWDTFDGSSLHELTRNTNKTLFNAHIVDQCSRWQGGFYE